MGIQRSSQRAFPEEPPVFQVAPMIDVLLVLMTFFMSITSTEILRTKTKLNLQLPVAGDSKAKESALSEVVINVGWVPSRNERPGRGVIEFEEKIVNKLEDLTGVIVQRKSGQLFFRAVIRAAEDAPYSYVQQVVRACAEADVDNITFAVLSKGAPTRTLTRSP